MTDWGSDNGTPLPRVLADVVGDGAIGLTVSKRRNTDDMRELVDYIRSSGGGSRSGGLLASGWLKVFFALTVSGIMGIATWVLFVRDDLKSLHYEQESHETHGHKDTTEAVNDIRERVGDMETTQAVQTKQLQGIEKGIEEIKRSVR